MLKVRGSKLRFRPSDRGGWEYSEDGETWYLVFRSEYELREMWGDRLEGEVGTPEDDTEEREREIFGETLDDEIPDDLWDLIKG
jgi:hypothetical protein